MKIKIIAKTNIYSEDFIAKWHNLGFEQYYAQKENLAKYSFGKISKDFLFELGMPSDVIGSLMFEELGYGLLENLNKSWSLNKKEFENYLVIGSNDCGDPIVLNLKTEELIYLNHDNHFEEIFIASNLKKFALVSILVLEFRSHLKLLTANSYSYTEFSDKDLKKVKNDIVAIDSKIWSAKDSHWKFEFEYWKHERDEERKKNQNS